VRRRFIGEIQVRLVAAAPEHTLYFTMDGSEPSAASPRYMAPITISASTIIKTIAYRPNCPPSGIATADFTCLSPSQPSPALPGEGGADVPVPSPHVEGGSDISGALPEAAAAPPARPPSLSRIVVPAELPAGKVGKPYSFTPEPIADAQWIWLSQGFIKERGKDLDANGLSVDRYTGTISGTPRRPGRWVMTVIAGMPGSIADGRITMFEVLP
jgi:hypothetical protein